MRVAFLFTAGSLVPLWTANSAVGDDGASSLRPVVYKSLPFDLDNVPHLEAAGLSDEAKAKLAANGFVVTGPATGSMPNCYSSPEKIRPFITIDSVLEVFLAEFELAWSELEDHQADQFASLQVELWNALGDQLEQMPAASSRAAYRALGLLAVARLISDENWQLPETLPGGVESPTLRKAVASDFESIQAAEGIAHSALWNREVDWSIFAPVGPYAATDKRRRFYQLSQWWGRLGLRADDANDRLCSAVLTTAILNATEAERSDELQTGPLARLRRINETYDLFFGPAVGIDIASDRHLDFFQADSIKLPHDLGTKEFDKLLQDHLNSFPVPKTRTEWAIPGPGREPGQIPRRILLLGPRSTPGSHVFAHVVDPAVETRLLPSGLDLMAVFGSRRARELTLQGKPRNVRDQLDKQIEELKSQQDERDGRRWPPSRFQDKLRHVCMAIAQPRDDERQPLFSRTDAYRDRGLAAALATWAAAREVYSVRLDMRGGVGGISDPPPPGLVDPNLDAWQRLIEWIVDADDRFERAGIRMDTQSLEMALQYRRIAEKQLRGEQLTRGECYAFFVYWLALENRISIKKDGNNREIDRRVEITCG